MKIELEVSERELGWLISALDDAAQEYLSRANKASASPRASDRYLDRSQFLDRTARQVPQGTNGVNDRT